MTGRSQSCDNEPGELAASSSLHPRKRWREPGWKKEKRIEGEEGKEADRVPNSNGYEVGNSTSPLRDITGLSTVRVPTSSRLAVKREETTKKKKKKNMEPAAISRGLETWGIRERSLGETSWPCPKRVRRAIPSHPVSIQ